MRIVLTLAAVFTLGAITAGVAQAERHVFEEEVLFVPRPKPQVMVVITRKNLDEDFELALRESFLPAIVQSVDVGPF